MQAPIEGGAIGAAIRTSLTSVVIVGGLLLVPAGLVPGGTWVWPRAIAFVAGCGAISGIGNLALARWRPEHFRVRQQSVVAARAARQPLADAVGSAALLAIGAAWLAFIPIDVFALHALAPPSPWISLIGGAASLVGLALTPMAAWENRFATPNVQIQAAQTVVRSGIYRLIRHPIYLGNLLFAGGAALWLGSYAGLWGFAVLLIATIARIRIEEKNLLSRVPDYAAYARDVRARLIPFLI